MVRRDPWGAAAALVAWLTILAAVGLVMAPWLADPQSYGFHDWDVVSSFRWLARASLVEHGELPGFNPYACGGYPLWGYVEGATNVVSPWLPAYLLFPLPIAIRIETAGMALGGAVGAYLAAGCFTRSRGARLLVVALWAVNGRWALQAAAGHTWHFAYALTPFCLLFFERARAPGGRVRDVALAGGAFALMLYAGGIYPLPHTVLLVGCYAVLVALFERSARPLLVLAAVGLVALGFAAPKLLPVLDTFGVHPRLVASDERLDLGAFVTALTSRDQHFYARPAAVRPYGWHEWGMYVSAPGLALLVGALVLVDGARERALKLCGLGLLLLGFGAFHPSAPWTLLHAHVPVFRSQHVPSRFLYPAVLVLALVAAAGIGRFVERARRRPWLDLALTAAVAALALDVARVAQQPMRQAMWMKPPAIPAGRAFRTERRPPFQYERRDWAAPMLLSMMANTGVLECYGVPREEGAPGPAASGEPGYRGELYVEGGGSAQMLRWSPSSVTVAVRDATSGARLVYNVAHWRGWRASHGSVEPWRGLVSVPLSPGESVVRLWYRPPGLGTGIAWCAATVGALVWAARRQRRSGGSAS
jgi:hypothetical protein